MGTGAGVTSGVAGFFSAAAFLPHEILSFAQEALDDVFSFQTILNYTTFFNAQSHGTPLFVALFACGVWRGLRRNGKLAIYCIPVAVFGCSETAFWRNQKAVFSEPLLLVRVPPK